MFVKKENTQRLADEFVRSLSNRKIDRPMIAKDRFNEELAFNSFKSYIGSISCAMSYRRIGYIAQDRSDNQF